MGCSLFGTQLYRTRNELRSRTPAGCQDRERQSGGLSRQREESLRGKAASMVAFPPFKAQISPIPPWNPCLLMVK